jgi:hypothetical protein
MKNFRDSSIWRNKIRKQWSVASRVSNTLCYINVVNQVLSEYLQIDYITHLLLLFHDTISVSELQDGADVTSQ